MVQIRFFSWGWRHAFPGLSGQKPIPPESGGPIQRSFLAGGLAWGRFDDGERFLMVGPFEVRWLRRLG